MKKLLFEREEIVFVYLYGSMARGTANKLSDIDIAVYIDKNKKPESGSFGYRSELITELQSLLNREVDLVILNDVSISLAFNILKDGKLLLSKSKRKRIEFHRAIMVKYLDFNPMYNIQEHYLNKSLKDGHFGR